MAALRGISRQWKFFGYILTSLVLLLAAVPVLAQQTGKPETFAPQITGTPGSPSATTTIDGKQLPPPPPKFGGVIKEDVKNSKPWWPPRWCHPRARPTCS